MTENTSSAGTTLICTIDQGEIATSADLATVLNAAIRQKTQVDLTALTEIRVGEKVYALDPSREHMHQILLTNGSAAVHFCPNRDYCGPAHPLEVTRYLPHWCPIEVSHRVLDSDRVITQDWRSVHVPDADGTVTTTVYATVELARDALFLAYHREALAEYAAQR